MKKNPMKTTTPLARDSISRSRLRYGLFVIPLVLAVFALSPTAEAQLSPPPDGGYDGNNTAEGTDALFSLTTGTDNTAIGFDALFSNTTGSENTAIGSDALLSNTAGIRNVANGFAALESNTTGVRNTATGRAALANNTTGNDNTGDGHDALFSNTTGIHNTATGSFALLFSTTANDNTADGYAAMLFNTIGNRNAAVGYWALYNNTTGNNNTANGYSALVNNTTGNDNIALGNFAGSNLTTGNNNIDIGNQGVASEAGTIRIGTQGTQTAAYIAGVSGGAVAGSAVKVNAAGKIGTAPSSARFKQDIRAIGGISDALYALKPVTFRYKQEIEPEGIQQFGLVAEEVEKVNPDLIIRGPDGKPYSVRYEAVNAMLLNEFLKEHRKIEDQQATITELKSTVAQQHKDFQATAARQQKQIEALTAGLQKVSAQLEASQPAGTWSAAISKDNLSKSGWSWGCVSAIAFSGRTIWIADAHRSDGKRFVVPRGRGEAVGLGEVWIHGGVKQSIAIPSATSNAWFFAPDDPLPLNSEPAAESCQRPASARVTSTANLTPALNDG